MKIDQLNLDRDGDFLTASARVRFENSQQPEKTVFIKTPVESETGFGPNADAVVTGCLRPALHLGEERVWVDGDVCPFLKEGLNTAMHLLHHWTGGKYRPIPIESKVRESVIQPAEPRAGMVMSGGMDSLAALHLNRVNFPKGHPCYVKDSFFIHGFDIGGVVERGAKYHVYDRAVEAITKITRDAGTELIPVYTNIRHLCDERELWLDSFFGAVLGAVSHAFSGRINMMYIGSSYDIPHLHPCGSHPLLDPEYSSYGVRIRHRDYEMSRVEKIQAVSQWDTAFQNFRVCLANTPDRLNCGKCEKCVRTMIELTALGLLDKTSAFVEDKVLPEHLEPYDITIRVRPPFYFPLIPMLREQGRDDMADLIEEKLKDVPR